MNTSSSKQILFLIIGIHAVYFLAACYFKGIYLIDSYGYLMQADNIKDYGTWYAEDWNAPLLVDYFSIRPPLYALFLIILHTISENILFVLFVQNIISIINCWLVYEFVKKQVSNADRIQFAMIAGLLFYPAQMMHANFVMTEIVFQSFMLLLFLSMYEFMKQPQWKCSLRIAILLSLCLLTKPISLLLPVIAVCFMLWAIVKQRSKWIFIATLLLPMLTFHAICLQNRHATGYYHYSSIKSINQLKYNARYTLVNAKGEVFADSSIAACMQLANAQPTYGERLQLMDAKASGIIREYPLAFIKLYIKGVAAFFLDPGRFDVYHFFAIEDKGTVGLMYEIQTHGLSAIITYLKTAPVMILGLLFLNFCWNLFACVCLLFFVLGKIRIPANIRILVFVFVFYIAAATGPVGVSRYRVPVYPFLLMSIVFISQRSVHKKHI
jgi:hypothetical protein